jgi:hypothetical protein
MPAREPKFDAVMVEKLTTIKGGLLKKPMSIRAMTVHVDGSSMEFAHLTTKQDWLCKAVTGECVSRRPLGRVKLLKTLTRKLFEVTTGTSVEVDGEAPAKDDPMDSLGWNEDSDDSMVMEDRSVVTDNKKGKKRSPRTTQRKNCVIRLDMPERCPEKYPGSDTRREIRCFVKSKREIWLGIEDVPWAVQYMHDQYRLGGIPVDASSSSSSTPTCNAADDSPGESANLHWDFASSAWVATVEKDGTIKRRSLKPDEVQLDEASTVVDVSSLQGLQYKELKNIAAQILLKWSKD